jgi:hypothetical protein
MTNYSLLAQLFVNAIHINLIVFCNNLNLNMRSINLLSLSYLSKSMVYIYIYKMMVT